MEVEANEFCNDTLFTSYASFVAIIFVERFSHFVPLLKELNIDGIPAGFLVTAIQQIVAFLVFLVAASCRKILGILGH